MQRTSPLSTGARVTRRQALEALTPPELRFQVLNLYRRIMRDIHGALPSEPRNETYLHARGEFERNRSEPRHEQVGWLLHNGDVETRAYSRYLRESKHFYPRRVVVDLQKREQELLKLRKVTLPDRLEWIDKKIQMARDGVVEEDVAWDRQHWPPLPGRREVSEGELLRKGLIDPRWAKEKWSLVWLDRAQEGEFGGRVVKDRYGVKSTRMSKNKGVWDRETGKPRPKLPDL